MSIEDKFHKLIQEHGQEERNAILEDIYAQMPELAPKSKPVKKRMSLRQKLCISMPIVAVCVCAAIVLPCVLIDNNPQTSIPTTYNYVQGIDFESKTDGAISIKEYNDRNGTQMLYFDWYDTADDVAVNNYVGKTDNILGIEEKAVISGGEEFISIAAMKSNIYLDTFTLRYKSCTNSKKVDNVELKWDKTDSYNNAMGFFEHNGYRYYITLEWSADENRLFELVSELLN